MSQRRIHRQSAMHIQLYSPTSRNCASCSLEFDIGIQMQTKGGHAMWRAQSIGIERFVYPCSAVTRRSRVSCGWDCNPTLKQWSFDWKQTGVEISVLDLHLHILTGHMSLSTFAILGDLFSLHIGNILIVYGFAEFNFWSNFFLMSLAVIRIYFSVLWI